MPSTLNGTGVTFNDATTLQSGNIPAANLGTGTANSTTFLRGDKTWATPGAAAPVVDTFNSSGTWTKPSTGTMARIQVWSGGGGGARGATGEAVAYGGGGGGYVELQVPLSTLGATVTVTVGAGGTGRTGSTGNGTAGGNSSFGSIAVVVGGQEGKEGFSSNPIPKGGYPSTPGTVVWQQQANKHWVGGGISSIVNGDATTALPESFFGGGLGASANGIGGSSRGGSVFGGAGGTRGGQGLGNGGAGTAPGGGGGGANTNDNGGNGAAGRVIVTVW